MSGDGRDADGPDVDLAWDLLRSAETTGQQLDARTRDQVRHLLAGSHTDRDATLLVLDGALPVGLLVVCPVRGRTVFLEVHARPGYASELVAPLLTRGLARARGWAGGDDDGTRTDLDGDPYGADPRRWQAASAPDGADLVYQRLLADHGFRRLGRFASMQLDLMESPLGPHDPAPPAGVTRVVARTDEQLRAAHRVLTFAFRDHLTSVPRPFDEWLAGIRELPGHDPDGIWLGLLGDRPVAACIVDGPRLPVGESRLACLGVLRDARRRGIARWLLGCAAADGVRRRLRSLALTVDCDSSTGAVRLYESFGMKATRTIEDWRRPLP